MCAMNVKPYENCKPHLALLRVIGETPEVFLSIPFLCSSYVIALFISTVKT